jgi:peptide deformylase
MEKEPPTLTLIPDSDPRLHQRCEVINAHTYPQLSEIVAAMYRVMFDNEGMGLAAPQVGINARLFLMHHNAHGYVCINPRIEKSSEETSVRGEGCLSYPGEKVMVERPVEVRVTYQNLRGAKVKKKLNGLLARCFQHEMDHLDGIVMSDVGVPDETPDIS